jgi:hypothetical protein
MAERYRATVWSDAGRAERPRSSQKLTKSRQPEAYALTVAADFERLHVDSNCNDAIEFLQQHQPMPPDIALTDELIDAYDVVLRILKNHICVDAVKPLLLSFGAGDGRGAYQRVEDVLDEYPVDVVVVR